MDRRNELVIADCGKCKAQMNKGQRQALGCGYEPPIDRARLTMWSPPTGKVGYSGPNATVCAGYSTSLPEVIETAIARRHWEKSQLQMACDGEQPTEETRTMVLILDGAFADVKNWAQTPSKDGGGQE
jgi:hypothetical protein